MEMSCAITVILSDNRLGWRCRLLLNPSLRVAARLTKRAGRQMDTADRVAAPVRRLLHHVSRRAVVGSIDMPIHAVE